MPTNWQMEKIKELYNKYHEQIVYIFYGGLTTAVNFLTYTLLAKGIGAEEMAAQLSAWLAAVLFAFFTNKFRVFKKNSSRSILSEFFGFFGGRVLSGVIENGGFWIFVKLLACNDFVVKIALSVFSVLFNYIFSKFLIFRK